MICSTVTPVIAALKNSAFFSLVIVSFGAYDNLEV